KRFVGNKTRAPRRADRPEAPSTDGRAPHTFEESGKEARWYLKNEVCIYFSATDSIGMMVESVGDDADVADKDETFVIPPPGGKAATATAKIGQAVEKSPTGK